ncbi:MAG: PAS domain-containing protein, partial [Proteobacteria bacterium]|nr:PAS domain-containing protein [Pseudomonadota bacterium]
MSRTEPRVHIAVLEPAGGPGGGSPPAVEILACLAEEAVVDRFDDPERCRIACQRPDLGLLVLDRLPATEAEGGLAWAREVGCPVVWVTADEVSSLEAFGLGAADCVCVGPDFEDVLPEVALEQIRRWQEQRERGAAESRIRWLEGLNNAIVTEIPAALAVIDGRERIVTVNPEFSRALRVDARDAVGRHFDQVLPADLAESGELRRLVAETMADRGPGPRLARTQRR